MDTVSRLVVLSPDSPYSPSYLARAASALDLGIGIKQTCFGILLEGPEETVKKAVTTLRAIDPLHIYTKMRAFPLGDARRCRAQRGAARPGFYFLEREIDLLPLFSKALACADASKEAPTIPERRAVPPGRFRKIMEETL